MRKSHLKKRTLLRWLDGELDHLEFLKIVLETLTTHCSSCRRAWRGTLRERVPGQGMLAGFQREALKEGVDPARAVREAVDRVLQVKQALFAQELRIAEQALPILLTLPRERQQKALRENEEWSSNFKLAVLLLQKSRATALPDPAGSWHFAKLASSITAVEQKSSGRSAIAADLSALAEALHGNFHRICGAYREAESCFRAALKILDQGSGDPTVLADVLSYRASLLRDQVKLLEAEKLIRHAIKLYGKGGNSHSTGRAQMKLGLLLRDRGELEQAAMTLRIATESLDFDQEPILKTIVFRNLALCEAEGGDPAHGLDLLQKYVLEEEVPERVGFLVRWAEGAITILAGKEEAGLAMVEAARQGFLALEDAPNAAACTVELALFCAKLGRTQDVHRIALEALSLLLPLDLPDAALATFMLLEDAAVRERLSIELLRKMQEKIRKPSLWRGGPVAVN